MLSAAKPRWSARDTGAPPGLGCSGVRVFSSFLPHQRPSQRKQVIVDQGTGAGTIKIPQEDRVASPDVVRANLWRRLRDEQDVVDKDADIDTWFCFNPIIMELRSIDCMKCSGLLPKNWSRWYESL